MAKRATRWRKPFEDFLKHMRIDSKEVAAVDDKGSPLNLWDSQRIFLNEVSTGLEEGQHTFVALKARQLGVSTVSLAIDIFWLLIHPGLMGALVTDTESNRNIFRVLIQRYVENLPEDLVGENFKLPRINRDFVQFPNGSRLDFIVAGTRSKSNWGESRGYVLQHMTEVANYGDPNGLASFRETFSETHPNRLCIMESPLALDTLIPTPRGWTTMGKIKEGNYLYDDKGKPCRVTGVSPVFINKNCYEIEFSTGDRITATEDHKWKVAVRRWPTNPQWQDKIIATKDLDPKNHRIALPKPLEMEDIYLPIDPYLLGVWLGDGRTDNVVITAGDEDIEEIRNNLKSRGYALGPVGKYDWRVGKFTVLGQRLLFTRLGLLGNKHIPDAYLRASERQRRELLAGLMDTDGSIDKDSLVCVFCSTLPALITQVAELLSSLGIKYKRSALSVEGKLRTFPSGLTYACSASERLAFSEAPDLKVFNLRRKAETHKRRETAGKVPFRWRKAKFFKIVSVKPVPSVPTRCIEVDSPSHLFLVGNSMIPTHNTAKGFNHWKDIWDECARDPYSKRGIFIGWWAKDLNRISRRDKKFSAYGIDPPDGQESELINAVYDRFGFQIDVEQLAWIRWRTSDQSADVSNIAQNLPWVPEQAFVFSGFSFFQTRLIARDLADMDEKEDEYAFKAFRYWVGTDFFATKMEQLGQGSSPEEWELRVWEEPIKNAQYVIGCDPAFGRTDWRDRSCISIWRCYADRLVQVAEFASDKVETHQLAWILAHLASAYKNCIVNLELSGGVGKAVMRELDILRNNLRQEMYSNQLREFDWEDVLNGMRWFLYHRPDSMGAGYVYNFLTTRDSKFDLMNRFRSAYTTRVLNVRSRPLLSEMQAVIQEGSTIEAPGREKDDRVIGAALAYYAYDDWVRGPMVSEGLTYERVRAEEAGEISSARVIVDRIVFDYFKRAEEAANADPRESQPKYLLDRGLI